MDKEEMLKRRILLEIDKHCRSFFGEGERLIAIHRVIERVVDHGWPKEIVTEVINRTQE